MTEPHEPDVEEALPEDLAVELKAFIESVGGIERAMEVFDDLESADATVDDDLKEAA